MTRKMASIQRILALDPIHDSDNVEVASVQGWKVVTNKANGFKVGDLVVYCEIDSWLPTAVAPFLTKAGHEPKEYNGVKGERLKTAKIRKQLSQGLILPLSILTSPKAARPEEGDDVTEALGIQKWEAPEEKAANNGVATASKTRAFPYFLRKTDQPRVQNMAGQLEKELDTEWEVTVKKDGSSCTVFRVDPESEYYADAKRMVQGKYSLWTRIKNFVLRKKDEPVYGICSRNVLLTLNGDSNFHRGTASALAFLRGMDGGSVALQGEIVAPDIQGNFEKVKEVEYHLFDIFSIDTQQYALPEHRQKFAQMANIRHATVVDKGTLRSIIQYKEGDNIVDKLLTYAEGEGDNPGVKREGIVLKAMNKDLSMKAVANSYLLKKG